MTQISPKPGFDNNSNGRGSDSKSIHVEGLTSVTNYSPTHRVQSYQEQTAIKRLDSKTLEEIAQPQGDTRQQHAASRWRFASLRTKVTALALAIGTIPVMLVGTTAYFAASHGIREQIVQNERTNAKDLEDKLNIFIKERYGDIVTLSKLEAFTNPKVRDALSPQEKEAILNDYLKSSQIYDSIVVYDPNSKKIVAASEGDYTLEGILAADYTKAVLEKDRPVIVDPRPAKVNKVYSFFTAAPIKDKATGKTIAIVRARTPMTLINQLFRVDASRGQGFYLTDSTGEITASDEQQLLQKNLEKIFPSLTSQIKQQGKQSLTTIAKENQKEQIFTYVPNVELANAYNINWGLVLARSTEVAFAPQRDLLLTLLLGTSATAVLVGIIAAFIANRGTRPILAAANAVDKIGQGELDTRLEVKGEDELAALTSNINQMASQLEIFVQEQALLTKVTGSRTFNLQQLNDLFGDVLEDVRQILNADRVLLYRFNESDNSGYVSAEAVARGWNRALTEKIEGTYIPPQLREVYTEGHVFSSNNIAQADLYPEPLRFMERLQVKAYLEVPILHEGQLFGLLMVHHCAAPHVWQSAEINFFKQLTAQLELSLNRVLLLEETEQLAEEQRQLKEGLQKRALELLKEVDPISKGDLTIRAKVTADEIGTIADSYNATVANLRKIVTQVQEAATQVAQTTSTSEASVQALSTEALRQAEEIATALQRAQQMAESVRLVAANAEQAEAAVKQAAQTVEEGDQAMNRTVDGILTIRQTIAETAKKVKHLGESSQKISTVVNLISTFAAQTNLLALNASIEAARAGEEGRGFAVVADEVRALARQSAEATSEIEKLVAAIQSETNEVVTAMEAGTEQVVTGTKLVDETRASLNKITAASIQINELVEAITQATVVQTQASEEVTQTMTNVAAIAEKTSKEAHHVSSSFEELLTVAQTLQEDVRRFKVS